MSIARSPALRTWVIALFGLGLGAALAAAVPVPKGGPPGKSAVRKQGAARARTFASLACVTQGINCNSTISGELTDDDCRLATDASPYDRWTFQGAAGQNVQITMTANFDTVLWLYNSRGDLVAFNDDIDVDNNNLNSRITFQLAANDTYTIYANCYDPDSRGIYSLELVCSTVGPPPTCTATATSLCLNAGRFRVSVIFSAPSLGINNAPAQAVPLTSDTGYFWFFSSNNVELVTKVVDGRAFNQHYWVFYGALSDVQYTITVTDTITGAVRTYANPQGHLASVADVVAFPAGSSAAVPAAASEQSSPPRADAAREPSREVSALSAAAPSAVCLADSTTLCLNNGRFQVRVIFNAPSLGIVNGSAQAVPLTSDTGYFWFFSANNVELVIKAVDGRAFNQFFWVFYGALSDVQYTITVTDSQTGSVKTYTNPQGQLASVADVAAFR
ncbi:MAG TPA: hypothetical protein VIY96_10300 [Thermoanaerobaculia bacterium]